MSKIEEYLGVSERAGPLMDHAPCVAKSARTEKNAIPVPIRSEDSPLGHESLLCERR